MTTSNPLRNRAIKPVAIVGGGITGLTVAYRLIQKGIPATIYEASDHLGGVIRSIRRDGYLAEAGPNTILETSPRVAELVRDLGLENRRLYSDPAAKHRYVVRNRKLINMPSSPLGFLATRLFSPGAKLRLLAEPFIRPALEAKEESVSQFVVRRLGHEFLDHAIDALVSGVYAGDPEKLSVRQAFPKLHKLEQRYGSLIKGQIFGARARARSGEVAKPNAPKFSFDDGLQVLTDALHRQVFTAVRPRSAVTKLAQGPSGWRVTAATAGDQFRNEHSAVLYAGTAFRLPAIEITTERYINWSPFAQINYPPVASVVLGFRRDEVGHPLDGFGMLIPRVEGFHILGTIFSSSLFPNRAPAGHVTLTSYVGGARSPELAGAAPEELTALALADLRALLRITGQPTFQHVTMLPKAIPQYEVGYGRVRALMTEIEAKAPGLFLAGHYRDGISLADSIVSAGEAAERIESYLASEAATATGRAPETSALQAA